MRATKLKALCVTVAILAAPAAVAGKPSLQAVMPVEDGLLAVSVADKIRRECGEISGRLFRAQGFLRDLYAVARASGYTDAEIEAYVDSDAQKKRMRAKRDAYLTARGVVQADPATYCAAGHAEIKKSSQIGVLLRAR